MSITLQIEDVSTGVLRPIPTEKLRLIDFGSKPTIRAKTDPAVPAIRWDVLLDGQPTIAVKSWLDTNHPFRLIPKDGHLPLDLVGVLAITATPCQLNGDTIGPAETTTLVITAVSNGAVLPPKTGMTLVGCWDYDQLPDWVPQISRCGILGVRCFGNSFNEDGKIPVGSGSAIDCAVRMHSAAPRLLYIDLRGGKQGKNGVGGQVLSEDGLKKSAEAYANAIADLGRWFVCEGPYNEINLREYFDLKQNQAKPDPRVVKYAVRGTQILRAAIGPDRDLVSPTIGWTGRKDVHKNWIKAFADEGMFDPKFAANICGDHAYSYLSPNELHDQAQLVRNVIPSNTPLWWTECGIHYFPDYAKNQRKFWTDTITAAQTGGVALLAIYRGHVNADRVRKSDPVSMFNADGTPNIESLTGTGLRAS